MQSLRKRGSDAGARASWAFNLGELSDGGSGDDDRIPAIKAAPKHTISDLDVSEAEFIDSSTTAELDANLALTASPGRRKATRSGDGIGVLEAMDTAVDAAAMQLMSKAMKFISLEDSPPPCRTNTQLKSGSSPSSRSPLNTNATSSIFDKGLDAFGSMGKLVEGFAVTLDTVIGQAFEDWGTPKAPGREGKKRVLKPVGILSSPSQLSSSASGAPPKERSSQQWGDFNVEEGQNEALVGGTRTPGSAARSLDAVDITPASVNGEGTFPGAPAANPYTTTIPAKGQTAKEIHLWRRRAQILQKELQKLRAQRNEYQHVKKEYENLQQELKNKATSGDSGNNSNKTADFSESIDGDNNASGGGVDSLASEQVMGQMEALIAEKAQLAQENDRLLRENTGLHELLEFTMQHHVADLVDDELFADDNLEKHEEGGEVGGEDSFETAEGGSPSAIEY
ncbi:hypothetical protein Ndes2526B_g06427 [Nannochloris sp. 'desiccata']